MSTMQPGVHENDVLAPFLAGQHGDIKSRNDRLDGIPNWNQPTTDGALEKMCHVARQIWKHDLLKAWLNPAMQDKTEKILLIRGKIETLENLDTEASGALACLAGFLDERTHCITLYHSVAPDCEWERFHGIERYSWLGDGLRAVSSLISQLVVQIARKRQNPGPILEDIAKKLKRYRKSKNMLALVQLSHEVLDTLSWLSEDKTVYIIMDFNTISGPPEVIQAIMDLTDRPDTSVRVLIANVDDEEDYPLFRKPTNPRLACKDEISVNRDKGKSNPIDFEQEIYGEWKDAIEGNAVLNEHQDDVMEE